MPITDKEEIQRAIDFGAFYPASIRREDKLYHYTTESGMAGILSSGKLWATDYRFLNDREEFGLLEERMEQAIMDLCLWPDDEKMIWELLLSKMSRKDENEDGRGSYFVACFSTDPDSLLLWSEFADIRGCNLGFDNEDILSCCCAQGAYPGMVIYSKEEQVKWMADCFNALMKQGESVGEYLTGLCRQRSYKELNDYLDCVVLVASYYSMFFKRSIFEGEKEYRFVLHDTGSAELLYRQKGALRIPYVELSICDAGEKISLQEVHLNPKLHGENEKERLKELVGEYGVPQIVESRADLRY